MLELPCELPQTKEDLLRGVTDKAFKFPFQYFIALLEQRPLPALFGTSSQGH